MTKPLLLIVSSLALLAQASSALAQGTTAPSATPDPGMPSPPSGPAADRAASEVAKTRRLVRAVNENAENIKVNGTFGAQLWLVEGRRFFEDWKKPQEPTIDPVEIAQRGHEIFTVIVFYGAGRDGGGLSNVSYDIVVKRPNGSIYDRRDEAVGFQDLAPIKEGQVLLGRDSLGITIAPNDPPGLYTVTATVRDNVGQVNLPLVQHFVVR